MLSETTTQNTPNDKQTETTPNPEVDVSFAGREGRGQPDATLKINELKVDGAVNNVASVPVSVPVHEITHHLAIAFKPITVNNIDEKKLLHCTLSMGTCKDISKWVDHLPQITVLIRALFRNNLNFTLMTHRAKNNWFTVDDLQKNVICNIHEHILDYACNNNLPLFTLPVPRWMPTTNGAYPEALSAATNPRIMNSMAGPVRYPMAMHITKNDGDLLVDNSIVTLDSMVIFNGVNFGTCNTTRNDTWREYF